MLNIFTFFPKSRREPLRVLRRIMMLLYHGVLWKDFWMLLEADLGEESQWMWGNHLRGLFR